MERSGGVAAIVCDTIVRQGYCYTCLAIGGGISVGSLSPYWNSWKTGAPQKIKTPQKIAKRLDSSELCLLQSNKSAHF